MIRQAFLHLAVLVLGVLVLPTGGSAQGLQALARVDVSQSAIEDGRGGGVDLTLHLSQPVPFRVFTLNDPARVVLDFKEVDWTGFDEEAVDQAEGIKDLRFGIFRPGWSRLVLDLAEKC